MIKRYYMSEESTKKTTSISSDAVWNCKKNIWKHKVIKIIDGQTDRVSYRLYVQCS